MLGLQPGASKAEIKAAFKKLALIHHPDLHANSSDSVKKAAEATFRALNEAHQALTEGEQALFPPSPPTSQLFFSHTRTQILNLMNSPPPTSLQEVIAIEKPVHRAALASAAPPTPPMAPPTAAVAVAVAPAGMAGTLGSATGPAAAPASAPACAFLWTAGR